MAKVLSPALAGILANLAKDKTKSSVQYLRDGEITLKLLMPMGRTDIQTFYEPFKATFPNGIFPYYLVAAVITDCAEDGIADPTCIRYVKVTGAILEAMVGLMGNRWDLFADDGDQIVITKGKKSNKISYTVAPIKETFSLIEAFGADKSAWPYPEQTIVEAAMEQQANSAAMDKNEAVKGEKLI